MWRMFSRRFALLAGVLVTLNVVLFFAAPGLAIRQALVRQLFGQKMIRAEVIDWAGSGATSDWRLDRGVITQVSSTQITLRERDGRSQQIPISSTTDVIRFGRHLSPDVLRRRWHVLVTWPANGPAQSVDVEKIPRRR
jgi:hypothetical protein